jgi:plastocyanin
MRRALAVCLALASLLLAAPAQAGYATYVAVTDFAYGPSTLSNPATSYAWSVGFQNGGDFYHSAEANGGMFDTGPIQPATTEGISLLGAGSYPFHCNFHPTQMHGTIKVKPVASASTVAHGGTVTIRYGADFLKGIVFDLQRKRNDGDWVTIASDTYAPTRDVVLQRVGKYRFRARTQFLGGGGTSGWSPIRIVTAT